jgi:hypothetical protein
MCQPADEIGTGVTAAAEVPAASGVGGKLMRQPDDFYLYLYKVRTAGAHVALTDRWHAHSPARVRGKSQERDAAASQPLAATPSACSLPTPPAIILPLRSVSPQIKSCPQRRPHPWTLCPFAHPGENSRVPAAVGACIIPAQPFTGDSRQVQSAYPCVAACLANRCTGTAAGAGPVANLARRILPDHTWACSLPHRPAVSLKAQQARGSCSQPPHPFSCRLPACAPFPHLAGEHARRRDPRRYDYRSLHCPHKKQVRERKRA